MNLFQLLELHHRVLQQKKSWSYLTIWTLNRNRDRFCWLMLGGLIGRYVAKFSPPLSQGVFLLVIVGVWDRWGRKKGKREWWVMLMYVKGGTIRTSLNLPAQSFYQSRKTLLDLCDRSGIKKVIFYCGIYPLFPFPLCWTAYIRG